MFGFFCIWEVPHLCLKHVHITNMFQLLLITQFLFSVYLLSLSKCEIKHYSIRCGNPQYCIIRSQETQVDNRAFSFFFNQNMPLLL